MVIILKFFRVSFTKKVTTPLKTRTLLTDPLKFYVSANVVSVNSKSYKITTYLIFINVWYQPLTKYWLILSYLSSDSGLSFKAHCLWISFFIKKRTYRIINKKEKTWKMKEKTKFLPDKSIFVTQVDVEEKVFYDTSDSDQMNETRGGRKK